MRAHNRKGTEAVGFIAGQRTKGDSPYALGPRPSSDSRPLTQTRSRRPLEVIRLSRSAWKPLRAKGSANT
jgi:hypothetical protein